MAAEQQQLDASATRHEDLAEDAIGEWLGGEESEAKGRLAALLAEVNMRAAEISEKSGNHPDHVVGLRRQADVFGAIGRIATRLRVRRPVAAVRVPARSINRTGARARGAGRPAGRSRARCRSSSRGGDSGDPHPASEPPPTDRGRR